MSTPVLRHSPVREIPSETLYRLLWLRVSVFVVEQDAAYPELDGRDLEPDAVLHWAELDGIPVATLRVLREPDAVRIGRVATAPAARGQGLAASLMRRAIAEAGERSTFVLDAQEQLGDWYARFGFVVDGPAFVEDGIPHIPMRRPGGDPDVP
ncbi:GNAT family N-acetyltransferase [uncultured Microbacterium sp.]|uniref:N-acetyltransferase domain-containing protein n=1 Tax=uncultured Microbacterium sp. TaxID=191216 RepID=A0A1Y5P920_9MICO|nr:GNAT family N-acetyltransferase [uncultured Microbacterium sp.]SBS72621.1 conserved hypothetical protein [uncultured Microbacterium sp.]